MPKIKVAKRRRDGDDSEALRPSSKAMKAATRTSDGPRASRGRDRDRVAVPASLDAAARDALAAARLEALEADNFHDDGGAAGEAADEDEGFGKVGARSTCVANAQASFARRQRRRAPLGRRAARLQPSVPRSALPSRRWAERPPPPRRSPASCPRRRGRRHTPALEAAACAATRAGTAALRAARGTAALRAARRTARRPRGAPGRDDDGRGGRLSPTLRLRQSAFTSYLVESKRRWLLQRRRDWHDRAANFTSWHDIARAVVA